MRTGDSITLDVEARTLHLDVPDAELARREPVTAAAPPATGGWEQLYREHVEQADQARASTSWRVCAARPSPGSPTSAATMRAFPPRTGRTCPPALSAGRPRRPGRARGSGGRASLVDTRAAVLRDITVVGLLAASLGLRQAIEALAGGAVRPEPLVARVVGLDDLAAVLRGPPTPVRRRSRWRPDALPSAASHRHAVTPTEGTAMADTDQHARTLAFQGAANRVVRVLLRTPLLARLVGARLLTVYVVGRKTGKRYTVPVAYCRHEGALLFGTEFRWVRNLRTGEPVEIRLKGRRRTADVTVTTDEAGWWPTTASSPATTTSSPGSTASRSTPRASPTRPTCTAAGPRAPEAVRLAPR